MGKNFVHWILSEVGRTKNSVCFDSKIGKNVMRFKVAKKIYFTFYSVEFRPF